MFGICKIIKVLELCLNVPVNDLTDFLGTVCCTQKDRRQNQSDLSLHSGPHYSEITSTSSSLRLGCTKITFFCYKIIKMLNTQQIFKMNSFLPCVAPLLVTLSVCTDLPIFSSFDELSTRLFKVSCCTQTQVLPRLVYSDMHLQLFPLFDQYLQLFPLPEPSPTAHKSAKVATFFPILPPPTPTSLSATTVAVLFLFLQSVY